MDLDEAVRLVRARGVRGQLCVIRDGQVVLDVAVGCVPESLFYLFSASKPFIAMLVHLLARRGLLSLDDPVAAYWPEFGRRGKETITIRHVLQHRAGLPVARGVLADGLAMTNWQRSVRLLERAWPVSPPGAAPAYHLLSFGFLLGEVVQRVTGAPVRDVLAAEVLEPLGLTDTHLGLPGALWPRAVPVRVRGRGAGIRQAMFNRRATRQAVIPAAGISSTARDLARFYQSLLDGGPVFDAETVAQACRPTSDGERDGFLGSPVRWAQGFQLGGPAPAPHRIRAMGALSSPLTFGHNGSNCCIGWADPTRRLAFGYVTDLVPGSPGGGRHQAAVADAILAGDDHADT